jgi:predicted kinase
VKNIIKEMNIPISVFISRDYDNFRKPHLGMWEKFIELRKNKSFSIKDSYYCGDSDGITNIKSLSDLYFAYNIGIEFKTIDEVFLKKEKEIYKIPYPLPLMELFPKNEDNVLINKLKSFIEPHIIILIGAPASGKTTFSNYLVSLEYDILNLDSIKDTNKFLESYKEKIEKIAKDFSENKNVRNIVIDNTNPVYINKEDAKRNYNLPRKNFIDIAMKNKIKVYAIWFNFSKNLVNHLNGVRVSLRGKNIPDIVYSTYFKYLQSPSINENINEIITLTEPPYIPDIENIKDNFYKFYDI